MTDVREVKAHRAVRECLRRYLEFEEVCKQEGSYEVECAGLRINFSDLKGVLKDLPVRQKDALFYAVICDYKHGDVAVRMGITRTSVGQYVGQATREIARKLCSDWEQ